MRDEITLRDVEAELRRRENEDPLGLWYKPYPPALKMHTSNVDIIVMLGGNRAGKSYAAMAEALDTALERNLWAPRRPQNRHGMAPVVWYIMPALTQAQRAVLPKFWHLVPRDRLVDWSEKRQRALLRGYDGRVGELWFLSAEMRQIRLQGASVDQIIMDETPNEDIYNEVLARLVDRRGQLIMVFSPVDPNSYWVRDKLHVPWTVGERTDVEFISFPVATEDGKPLVDHLTEEDVERMFRMYPNAADREARIFGRFTQRQGAVFRQLDPEIHLISPFKIPVEWTKFWVVDPQYHRFAALLFAVDPQGNYAVVEEYFSQDEPLAYRAARMWNLTQSHCEDLHRSMPAYVDTANPQDCMELNWHFRRLGAKLGAIRLPFEKDVHKMLLRAQNLLEPDETRSFPAWTGLPEEVLGAPRMFIFNSLASVWMWSDRKMRCSRLLWEMSYLVWDRAGIKPDKKSADGADCCDCLIYGANILARGGLAPQEENWMEGLSDADIILRAAERRQDMLRRVQFGGWEW